MAYVEEGLQACLLKACFTEREIARVELKGEAERDRKNGRDRFVSEQIQLRSRSYHGHRLCLLLIPPSSPLSPLNHRQNLVSIQSTSPDVTTHPTPFPATSAHLILFSCHFYVILCFIPFDSIRFHHHSQIRSIQAHGTEFQFKLGVLANYTTVQI